MKDSNAKVITGGGVVLTVLVVVMLGLALAVFIHTAQREAYDENYLLRSTEQRFLSQQIAKFALASAKGDSVAFNALNKSKNRFEFLLNELENGTADKSLPPSPAEVAAALDGVKNSWAKLRVGAEEILANRDSIIAIGEFIDVIDSSVVKLQQLSDDVVKALVKQRVPQHQIYIATQQLMLAQRISDNASGVLDGGEITASAADQFSRDTDRFGRVLEGMLEGDEDLGVTRVTAPELVQKLRSVAAVYGTVSDHAEEIFDALPAVLAALNAAADISQVSEVVSIAAEELTVEYTQSPGRLTIAGIKAGPGMVAAMGSVAGILLILLGMRLVAEARLKESESKMQNAANQKAILRLLDEMGDLADGDLTVSASVTEDITGAIADSINYAVEALRELVTTINTTSVEVSSAAQESRATAMHLAEASEHQADQIIGASEAIQDMNSAIELMSSDAKESVDVAQRSVDIATKGAASVRNTIEGMDGIREQIQETSKRIKRLGESSQEIGDIVELIDDIADQTNILALNAAMQAAMAGDAGRGFAVVADEVQRLAERSSNATKQIDALVKTIQSDTNEAVTSMEASTAGVVRGAKLAEEAGESLLEIETVSNYIAEMTGKISASAMEQSDEARKVSEIMSVIQEITTQTSEGTAQTSISIGALADMADELQVSVAGFKLPD
ncbi:MAG: methyl-accepting chemotaxis protein [Candidatus Polarisedimenticolaceae bacterium]|nr:methyl-accepting chemotaxis protein [Candidatus Polarisedimenticolaceae bacterium]